MPSRPRANVGQFVFHVFNRAIQTAVLFETRADFEEFLRLVKKAADLHGVRLLAYSVMPNHWHLVVWPTTDDSLSSFMQQLTMTHAKRWRERRGTTGRGAVYQGRFKAVPVQCDSHLVRLCCYVERNAVRARLAQRADEWEWSSASPLAADPDRPALTPWPVPKPPRWLELLNQPEPPKALDEIRRAVRKGIPFGNATWCGRTTRRLKWPVHGGRQGRPPARRAFPAAPAIYG